MKKLKNFFFGIITLLAVVAVGLGISAIVGAVNNNIAANRLAELEKIYDVSSIDDLYAMESNHSYQLMNDVDLQGRVWKPLSVFNFQGNEHTISNAVITEAVAPRERDSICYAAFFVSVNNVANMSFENVKVIVSDADYVAVAIGDCAGDAQSVQIANSSIDLTINNTNVEYSRIGFFAGKMSGSWTQKKANHTLQAVNITDSSIKINSKSKNTRLGGIVGECNSYYDVNECSIRGCRIQADAKKLDVGGIIGQEEARTDVVNRSGLIVNGNTFTISGDTVNFGGLTGISEAGYSNSASIRNTIDVTSDAANIGGLIGLFSGKIENCLSENNVIDSSVKTTKNASILCAGLVGSSTGTIKKCLSKVNTVSGPSINSDKVFIAGVVAGNSGSITYCLSDNNLVSGSNIDVFAAVSTVNNSYLYSSKSVLPNCNKIPILENETEVMQICSLDAVFWTFDESSGLGLILLK